MAMNQRSFLDLKYQYARVHCSTEGKKDGPILTSCNSHLYVIAGLRSFNVTLNAHTAFGL